MIQLIRFARCQLGGFSMFFSFSNDLNHCISDCSWSCTLCEPKLRILLLIQLYGVYGCNSKTTTVNLRKQYGILICFEDTI